MSYLDKWANIEARLKNIQSLPPLSGYIRDGIVNIDNWQNQEIRPLFIGKEAYGDGGWSITEHALNENPAEFCRRAPSSWRKTSVISYALQNSLAAYSDIYPIRNSNKVAESLRSIAFINVGKHGGGKTTSPQRLTDLYRQNRTLLHEQIALCQPNIIIGWNTLDLFEQDTDFVRQVGNTKNDNPKLGKVRSWSSDGKLFIATTHPAYFKIKTQDYVDGILNVVRANSTNINRGLPVF
ncbi:hypothetical protein [Hymenobacter sp. DG25A]|uniref:hypothetical protein n=1 Tax=Hymenobacter sp. DG25A TaxID=1385663 RepID=UPI000AFCBA91|nr:hypothetical protein [Hymenobacter sp. DG25A]